jgi:hypothetical protein
MEASSSAREAQFLRRRSAFRYLHRLLLDAGNSPIPLFTSGARASAKLLELTLNSARKLMGEPKLTKYETSKQNY